MFAEPLASLVDAHRDQLTETEQRLVQVLSSDPQGAAFLSGRELAQRAGVHESSAVRLAQKLGYDGYPAFRRALRQQQQPSPATRVARSLAAADHGDVLQMLLAKELECLVASQQHLDQRQIDAAARLVASARRVFVWATGNACVLAELLDRRLRSAGIEVHNIAHEGRELAERLVLLERQDVLVAFTFRRASPSLPVLLAHAREVGARSLLIADMVGHTLTARPDMMLAAPRGDDEKFLTLTMPMLITNALVLTIAQHDSGRSIRGLQTVDRLRQAIAAGR